VAKSLGRVIRHEIAPTADLIAIDGVQLKEFDYVDIGDVIELTNVVPISLSRCCSNSTTRHVAGFGGAISLAACSSSCSSRSIE